MELKAYQQQVLRDLDQFLNYVQEHKRSDLAFNKYWEDKLGPYDSINGKGMEPYKNNVPKAPHVCIKVPTAGGKTFIAANALEVIISHFDLDKPKSVVWLVPSITILDQTVKNLSNNKHPYRQKLNAHFKNKVEIYTKEVLLQGAGFNPVAVKEQLSICILSFDSLRARKKEDRKLFQENGNLAPFTQLQKDTSHVLAGTDETALINVIRQLNPIVIVDESHNAETELSVDMLRNLNPSFILDLTATPRKNSNIISFVDALALKKEWMVKLPVIVYNHKDRNGVIESAINLQKKLEAEAQKEEKQTGKHIRPIVLFQAQAKGSEDRTTFEKIKKILLDLQIPEQQIKIKTANINEIKDIDLMSRDCEVRYIITVNALKEGWDCPFAYILASLADKSSSVDVEQILGRVLRQPYVLKHEMPLMNMSFVLTASSKFMNTLESIVQGLNRAGFSSKDYKVAENELEKTEDQSAKPAQHNVFEQLLFTNTQSDAGTVNPTYGIHPGSEVQSAEADISREIDTTRIQVVPSQGVTTTAIGDIETKALEASREMDKAVQEYEQNQAFSLPTDLQTRVKMYKIKEVFQVAAESIQLPQFTLTIKGNSLFGLDGEETLLNKEVLLEGFQLSHADSNIAFDSTSSDLYKVDIEQTRGNEYTPTFSQIEGGAKEPLVAYILSAPKETQIEQLTGRMLKLVGNMAPIPEKEIKLYLRRIFDSFNTEQITDLLNREYTYRDKIKEKIKTLSEVHAEKVFNNYLDTDRIKTSPTYKLKPQITPDRVAPAITKSLYDREIHMNDFEARVINEVANSENVAFWHRNSEKNGFFYINGFINHYPDFIVLTKSGKILVIETKGDHLNNEDSKAKLRLGRKWSSKAGNKYKYFMVFETKEIEDAYRVDNFIALLRAM